MNEEHIKVSSAKIVIFAVVGVGMKGKVVSGGGYLALYLHQHLEEC